MIRHHDSTIPCLVSMQGHCIYIIHTNKFIDTIYVMHSNQKMISLIKWLPNVRVHRAAVTKKKTTNGSKFRHRLHAKARSAKEFVFFFFLFFFEVIRLVMGWMYLFNQILDYSNFSEIACSY